MRWVLIGALLLAAPSPDREFSLYPVLDRDQRLRQHVTVERTPDHMGAVIHLLARKTGVEVAVEGEFLRRPVVIELKDREAREIMTDIGILARGTWIKRKGAYLLMENANEAAMVQNGVGSQTRAIDATHRMIATLTPAQMDYLRSGRWLPVRGLTQQQQAFFAIAISQEYWRRPDRYPKSVLTGPDGAMIHLSVKDTGDGRESLIELCVPTITEEGVTAPRPFLAVNIRQ